MDVCICCMCNTLGHSIHVHVLVTVVYAICVTDALLILMGNVDDMLLCSPSTDIFR